MAGYDGYSMSNNARDAYEAGEKPLSKWTKKAIVEVVGADVINRNPQLKALKLKELRAIFLTQTAWHHTSKFYNETTFYACRTLEDIAENTEDAIFDLYDNPPYTQPVAPFFGNDGSPEAVRFWEEFEELQKKMQKLENIIHAIADGDIK